MNKIIVILIILLLNFGSISCKDKSSLKQPDSNTATQGGTTLNSDNKIANVVAPVKFDKVLIGKIDKYTVTMNLSRDGEKITGSYFYDNKIQLFSIGNFDGIILDGNVSSDGAFTIKETSSQLKDGEFKDITTGSFTGKLTAEQRNGNSTIKINGDWSNADGSKKLNFFLTENTISLGENLKVVDKEIKEDNKEKKYEFSATYPQIEGSNDPLVEKFNKELTEKINKGFNQFKEDISASDIGGEEVGMGSDYQLTYQMHLANKDLISLEFLISYYYSGAAHPSSTLEVINYNLKTGKELKLEEVFLKDSDYVSKINAICKKEDSRKEYNIFFDDDPRKNLESWSVSQRGIYFHFDVAHALGDVATVFIPYSELKDVIDPNSPIGSLVK